MSKKSRSKASTVTEGGSVELTEEQLTAVVGGANRRATKGDEDETSENVSLTFRQVKVQYTPQKA